MTYYIVGFVIGLAICIVSISIKVDNINCLESDIFKLEFRMDKYEAESKCIQDALLRELEQEKLRNERLIDYIRMQNSKKAKKKDALSLSKCEKR